MYNLVGHDGRLWPTMSYVQPRRSYDVVNYDVGQTYDIVCHLVFSHRMFAAPYRMRNRIWHRMSWPTMSYALIACSLHHIVCDIAYDIVGHEIRCRMLSSNVRCTTLYVISHTILHTIFHLIQIVLAKLRSRIGTALSKPVYLLSYTVQISGLGPRSSGRRRLTSAHMPTAWKGVPGWFGQQGAACKKTYDIVGQKYDIVCKHTMSVFTTTPYVRHAIHTISYVKKGAYDVVYDMHLRCRMYTTYVFLNLLYRIRVFLVTYDIVFT